MIPARPRSCPSCGALMGNSRATCPSCGAIMAVEALAAGLHRRAAASGFDRLDPRLVICALVLVPGTVVAPVVGVILCWSPIGRRFTPEQRSWIALIGACNAVLSAVFLFKLGGALAAAVLDALPGPWGVTPAKPGGGTLNI